MSFALGLLSVLCLGAAFAGMATGALLIIGFLSAIGAIVLGAIGLNKEMNGLAIAGMTIGILEILSIFVIIVLLIT